METLQKQIKLVHLVVRQCILGIGQMGLIHNEQSIYNNLIQ